MTTAQIVAGIVAAVMVFWSVGAYNRLVSLRNRIAQAFAAVDAQIQLRHALLLRWLQAAVHANGDSPGASGLTAPVTPDAAVAPIAPAAAGAAAAPVAEFDPPRPADAVHAAGQQLQAACDALRSRPGAASPAASLRLSEQTLAEARLRFGAALPGRPTDADRPAEAVEADARAGTLAEELSAADSTLGFARQQFNDAASGYNDALRQFPTLLVGWAFGFREAGTL